MKINLVGAFIRNAPFGTEIAFEKGLRKIGIDVNTVDPSYEGQKFAEDCTATVVFKWIEGTYREQLERLGGKKIVYQPDDLRFPHIKHMMMEMRKVCDSALTFDDDGAQLATSYGYTHAKTLLLTADNELYRELPGVKKDIDLCFVGSLTGGPNHQSRAKMLSVLGRAGLKVAYASDIYDIGRIVEFYNRSKIVLNHATDVGQPFGHGYGYQCRHFEAGFTKACVLSNEVDNDQRLQNFYTFNCEEDLVSKASFLLRHQDVREQSARDFYDELNKFHTPAHRAEELVQFIRSL